MKKFLVKILSFTIVATLAFYSFGCDFTPSDINNIVDNAFKNYSTMNSTETGEYRNFKSINVTSSYLGYGYDVINEPYMDKNSINFSAPILDMDKIENAQLKMMKENRSVSKEFESSTIQEFYQKYATSLSVYGKVGKMFSGGLKIDFSGSDSEKSYWHFYKKIYDVKTFNIYMVDSINNLRNMLSENFKYDLLNMEASALFDKYGTHLIKEAVMGGRMEISATYSSTSNSSSTALDAAVNAHVKFLGSSSLNAEASASYENALTNQNVQSDVEIKQFGGTLVNTSSIEALSQNYSKWVESFDNSLEYAALSGIVGENSLLGLWELLPEGNEGRANELKNKFIALSGDSYENLCAQFKLKNIEIEGGSGDASWSKIVKNYKRESISDANKYNPSKINTDQSTLDRHESWKLGELCLYGLSEENNKFVVKNKNDFSIRLHLLENIDSLPLTNEIQWYFVSDDTNSGVMGTNITDKVGKGAYWIRVTYTDDTQTTKSQVNCLAGKTKDEYIEFISVNNLEDDKAIKKIEIVFVYELECGANNFLNWWKYFANFRCEYVLNF